MRKSRELIVVAGLSIATLAGSVACSGEKTPVDKSGIEITIGNADARAGYLSQEALAKIQADVIAGKARKAIGTCVGYETTEGYNFGLDPYVYTLKTDKELFQQYSFVVPPTSDKVEDLQVLPGPVSYTQLDENGNQISAANSENAIDIYYFDEDHTAVNVDIHLVPNRLQAGLWALSDTDGDPVMFGAHMTQAPQDFEASCKQLLELYKNSTN